MSFNALPTVPLNAPLSPEYKPDVAALPWQIPGARMPRHWQDNYLAIRNRPLRWVVTRAFHVLCVVAFWRHSFDELWEAMCAGKEPYMKCMDRVATRISAISVLVRSPAIGWT